MPLPGPILAQFTDVVQHRPLVGRDAYGQAQYGAPVTIQARVIPSAARVADAYGREQVAKTVAYLATILVIGTEDQLTLPDGSTPAMLRIDRYPDARMPHTKVYF